MSDAPVFGFGLYGMYGPVTDPGERLFTEKVRALGVDVDDSPFRDYEVGKVADLVVAALKAGRKTIGWGSSLGANNLPVIATYVMHRLPGASIAGLWGFQASDYGAHCPVPGNVEFAHEVYNPNVLMTGGLGHYQWVRAPGNHRTNLYLSARYDLHPGESTAAQEMFLREIERVIKPKVTS